MERSAIPAVTETQASGSGQTPTVAVVTPCYRVGERVLEVLARIGPEVHRIYLVDDACPDHTGDAVEARCTDPRVVVLRHATNQGVGGAMVTGYKRALADGATVVVKVDGDGQMDPALIPRFLRPILSGRADYAKGNRFFHVESLQAMPAARLMGNAALSFVTKISSGYWSLFDPTNGYTAIHAAVLALLPLDKIARDYFFESDMLFRLNVVRAVVHDVPMDAVYGGEVSSLRIGRIIPRFLGRHVVNFFKRVGYSYFLRDFQLASVNLVIGALAVIFGAAYGVDAWIDAARAGVSASAGTVMVATLPILLGVQLLLQAVGFDIQNQPTRPIHRDIE